MVMKLEMRQTEIKENLILRANLIAAIRHYFSQRDYLEVETPIRIPAPAPEAHIDAAPCNGWYLHTSPELCMKRMLAAGYARIFQISRCFREQERGQRHLPEMTLLEWYTAGVDYTHTMDQCQALVVHVAQALNRYPELTYQGRTIDLSPPWPKLTVAEAFRQFGTMDMLSALENDRFDEIMGIEIEPQLGRQNPLFLYDYPTSQAALARKKHGRPHLAERFELYIAGLELCNAFSELTDPIEQRQRFQRELSLRQENGKAVYPLPEPFLTALESMPPASGNAVGVDRLMMLFADTSQIDDVVAFTPEEL